MSSIDYELAFTLIKLEMYMRFNFKKIWLQGVAIHKLFIFKVQLKHHDVVEDFVGTYRRYPIEMPYLNPSF